VAPTGRQWRFLPHDLSPWFASINKCDAGSYPAVSKSSRWRFVIASVAGRERRFRRLARDYEKLDAILKRPHLLALVILMRRNLAKILL
jgi:transposase